MDERTVVDQKTLKALAADTRMGIIRELSNGPLTPSDLGRRLKKSDATIVEHLEKLHDSGLVDREEERGKKWVFYSLTHKGTDIMSPRRFVVILSFSMLAILLGGSILGMQFISFGTFAASPVPIQEMGDSAPLASQKSASDSSATNEDLPGFIAIPIGLIAVGTVGMLISLRRMLKFRGAKFVSAIMVFFIFLSMFAAFAKADGMAIPMTPPYDPVEEKSQVAAINYKDGLQRMIISVNLDMQNISEAAWVFPVPSDPSKIVIDIVNNFPSFYGMDIVSKAKSDIDSVVSTSQFTQLYPLLFLGHYSAGTFSQTAAADSKFGSGINGVPSVTVYEHLEKDGITTEIVSARTGEALYYYLNNRGYHLPQGSIDVLDQYVGRDYSFVISWVTGPALMSPQFRNMVSRQPGLFITFPTERVYFPMEPTSVYGSKTIPIRIYLLDLYIPDIKGEMTSYASTRYFSQYSFNSWDFREFFSDVSPKGYTQLDIYAPSKYIQSDIWFDPGAPAKIDYAFAVSSYISGNFIMLEIAFIILLSGASGAIAGMVVFREWKKYAVLGMSNIFSIIGLLIGITFTNTKKLEEGFKKRLKQEGMIVISSDRRKVLFIIAFSITFMLLGSFVGILLKAPLG